VSTGLAESLWLCAPKAAAGYKLVQRGCMMGSGNCGTSLDAMFYPDSWAS